MNDTQLHRLLGSHPINDDLVAYAFCGRCLYDLDQCSCHSEGATYFLEEDGGLGRFIRVKVVDTGDGQIVVEAVEEQDDDSPYYDRARVSMSVNETFDCNLDQLWVVVGENLMKGYAFSHGQALVVVCLVDATTNKWRLNVYDISHFRYTGEPMMVATVSFWHTVSGSVFAP